MSPNESEGKPRGDQMTTDFFENVLTQYLADDRIESGVVRLELDDGRTRRVVVDDDTESLDPHEYLQRELAEVSYLIEANEELLDEPLELSIPVADADRVVEEAQQEEAVSTLFQATGIRTLLEQLQAIIEAKTPQSETGTQSGE